MSDELQPPNVLLIMTDQHTSSVAGFAGDPTVRTQHLDELAERSVQFDTALCPYPLCTPSRMGMLTGKDAHRCSGWSNHWVTFPEHDTWPAHFADHGYRTALVGKMHFGGQDQMQGFQVRPYGDLRHGLGHQPEPLTMFPAYHAARSAGITEIPESLLQDVVVTRETLAFLWEHHDVEPETPWFVCASYSRPHPPFTAPGRYVRRYQGRVPPPQVALEHAEELEPFARRRHERYQDLTTDEIARGREGYYACVDFVDDCIGELLEGLQAAGLLEDTIVIYTSDHGEMLGEHGLWAKFVYYEPAIAVPLLVSGPGVRSGHHRVADPISLVDLFPTVCALAGLPVPEGLDGVDFSAVLGDPTGTPGPRAFAFSSCFGYGAIRGRSVADDGEPCVAMRTARDARWKYVEVEGGSSLLFDLENDPHEQTNLAERPEHGGRCRAMREAVYRGFSWEEVHARLERDRQRLPEFASGLQPTTPNQYMMEDGRLFDAEGDLYGVRWLYIPDTDGGIIPQRFG